MPSATILRLEVQYRRIWRGAGHRRRFPLNDRISFGVPRGIRTLVTAVKGRCPRPTRRWGLVGRTETTLALTPTLAHRFPRTIARWCRPNLYALSFRASSGTR